MEQGFDDQQLQVPSVEFGVPTEPEALADPLGELESEVLPAPGLPEPPGRDDITIPPIDPGELIPPPAGDFEQIPDQPGQVELPQNLSGAAGVPDKLKIHPGFSSGVTSHAGQNEMTIVMHAVDQLGRTVDLSKFDIDAELSVVVLDPKRESAQSRVGRWDFSRR